jgi:hypothetical protein
MSRDGMNDESLRRFLAGPVHAVHLDYESQLVPYVEKTADAAAKEIIESHLDDCARCREDVSDLEATRRDLARPAPARRSAYRRLAAAAVLVAAAGALMVGWPRSPATRPAEPPATKPTAARRSIPVTAPSYANPEWPRLIASAVATKALPFPDTLAEVTVEGDALRSATPTAPGALEPAGRVIRSTQPQFRWRARRGATYVVLIYAGDEEVARSPSLTTPQWTPSRPLARGQTYAWQVNVRSGGDEDILPSPEEPPALFRITSAADEQNIDAALRAHPSDALLHAVVYAAAGLREEAEAALRDAADRGNVDARAILEKR